MKSLVIQNSGFTTEELNFQRDLNNPLANETITRHDTIFRVVCRLNIPVERKYGK